MNRLLGAVTVVGLVAGLVMAFGVAPREATQGNVQRIMYLHVPSVWVAYLAFAVVLVASVVYLARRSEDSDRLAHASAEVVAEQAADDVRLHVGTTVDEAERRLILRTLAYTGNNKTRAAEILGISLKTLHNKLNRYNRPP